MAIAVGSLKRVDNLSTQEADRPEFLRERGEESLKQTQQVLDGGSASWTRLSFEYERMPESSRKTRCFHPAKTPSPSLDKHPL